MSRSKTAPILLISSKVTPTRPYVCNACRQARPLPRPFTTTTYRAKSQDQRNGPFTSRLRAALGKTRIEWKPIPVGLGIAFLGAAQFYRIRQREKRRQQDEEESTRRVEENKIRDGDGKKPPKRERVRPSGPWYVSSELSTWPY